MISKRKRVANSCSRDRRGIALIMVMMVVSSLLIIGILFAGSVTAEYRAAVYYRQAIQSEQYCIVGLHRAMAELSYDVWGVYEDVPFKTARYNTAANPGPTESLQPLSAGAAYSDTESGSLQPIDRQRGYWNGQAWVVWAGNKVSAPAGMTNHWNMDSRTLTHLEMKGGAQTWLSYGVSQGTVSCTATTSAVVGTDTQFNKAGWSAGDDIYIKGVLYHIASVTDATNLTLQEVYPDTEAGLPWYAPSSESLPPSADSPPTFSGGCQSVAAFVLTGKGQAADPRWVNAAKFIKYQAHAGAAAAWNHGGVDLDGDGFVTADDKSLRNWALWQLKRDSFLPEGMDNNDLFQPALHANNRRLWGNKSAAAPFHDLGWEFIDPKIVGDSFYLIFRSDPLYSLHSDVSEDPTWAIGDPLDGSSAPGTAFDGKADQAGHRYPYDRTHLNKWHEVAWEDDAAGGLANINGCNNDYNTEQWTSDPFTGATPSDVLWYHYPEAKWIYCFDPVIEEKRYGRYAVTVVPDCGSWNASALHSGYQYPNDSSICQELEAVGCVKSAGGFLVAMEQGYSPRTGDSKNAKMLPQAFNTYCPIRPNPLPTYWQTVGTNPQDTNGDGNKEYIGYFPHDGSFDTNPTGPRPVADFSRAPEIRAGHGGEAWDKDTGVRSAIFSYLIWMGPYDSRAEFATHLRKGCLVIPNPIPDAHGWTAATRACMETDMSNTPALRERVAECAKLISSLSTVQGYYYTLDRFWERDLLVMNDGTGTSGSDTDPSFTTAQSERITPVNSATAAAKPGQKTRQRYMDLISDLECFGGYRTRDGSYKLLDYLFNSDSTGDTVYTIHEAYTGGAAGSGDPQKFVNRRQKFMAMTVSRLACQQRYTDDASTAACPSGHLTHNPRLSALHKSAFAAGTVTYSARTAASDVTVDELGQGCPVCGAKLFLAQVNDWHINEIGRFYEKFNNAERPVRKGYDVDLPAQKPARHFVELQMLGHYHMGGSHYGDTRDRFGRFDALGAYELTHNAYWQYPGVLCDPATHSSYFSSHRDYGLHWRMKSSEEEAIDPEPVFNLQTKFHLRYNLPPNGYSRDWHIMVYDDTDADPTKWRWHDVTHCVEFGSRSYLDLTKANSYNGKVLDYHDADLFAGQWVTFAQTADPDPTEWPAQPIRADQKYTIPDPDPANQQEADDRGLTAAVSIYRKMPVRWYGGDRKGPTHMFFDHLVDMFFYTYDHVNDWPKPQPTLREDLLGVNFENAMQLRIAYTDADTHLSYRGDYVAGTNEDGYPGPDARVGIDRVIGRYHTEHSPKGLDPAQYGVVTFDARFNGSRVAVVENKITSRGDIPDYNYYRISDYVELTDSAGTAIKISEACVEDPGSTTPNKKILSWQCRNGVDNRSNADGYMCWDLLPMTLQNTDQEDGLDPSTGYDVWPGWWGNNADAFTSPDGKFYVSAGGSYHESWRRDRPQVGPPGYIDMTDRVGNLRNSNFYARDYPARRGVFDGTTRTASDSSEAQSEALVYSRIDGAINTSGRTQNRKECTMSIPTGIGRQCSVADDADSPGGTPHDHASWPAAYAGRQHHADFAAKGWTWTEGNPDDDNYKWGAFSWNSWYDIYNVTDLCQQMLYKLGKTNEDRDIFDGDQDGERDELTELSMTYETNAGTVTSIDGRFSGEVKQINKLNLNELWYPPTFSGAGYKDQWYLNASSYTSFGRKPLKGFHSPSDSMTYSFGGNLAYNTRIKPWDLFDDYSEDLHCNIPMSASWGYCASPIARDGRFDPSHCGSSTVYTIFVTGNAVDEAGEPLAEMRARVTVERTWDGRMNILEFTWMPMDRGFME